MRWHRNYHKLFMIFIFVFWQTKYITPADGYTVLCSHATDVYTLNCRLTNVVDNTTLTDGFPEPLKNLTQYITYVSIATSDLTSIPWDIFDLFENLESLTVHADIKNLTQAQFRNASKLAILKLGLYNHLTHLESSLFANKSTLEYIDLAYNDISKIGENVFTGLAKLKFLYLEGNSIKKLSNNTFLGAENLEVLELSRNEISEIEDDAFNGLPNLKTLMLNRNQITILPTPIYHGLKQLKFLDMSLNQIAEIEEAVFDGMDKLRLIELGFNNLTSLSDTIFDGVPNLENLYISWNRLQNIDEPLKTLAKLKILDLSFNELEYINVTVLSNETLLEQLELRGIGLTSLPTELIAQQTELRLLDLSFNNLSITDLDFETLRPLHNLQSLKLENTSLVGISDEMKEIMPNLTFINLAGNEVDCESVHVLVEFFEKNNIEYEFGEPIDVGCTLLPFGSQAIQAYDLSHSKFLHVKEVLGPDYVDPLPPLPFPPPNRFGPDGPPDGFPNPDDDDANIPEKIGQTLFSFDLNPHSLRMPPNTTASTNATNSGNETVATTPASTPLITLNNTDEIQADLQSKSIYLFHIAKIKSEFSNDTDNENSPPKRKLPQNQSNSVSTQQIGSDQKNLNATQIQADTQSKSLYLFNIAKIISDFGDNNDTDIVQIVNETAESDLINVTEEEATTLSGDTNQESDTQTIDSETQTELDIDARVGPAKMIIEANTEKLTYANLPNTIEATTFRNIRTKINQTSSIDFSTDALTGVNPINGQQIVANQLRLNETENKKNKSGNEIESKTNEMDDTSSAQSTLDNDEYSIYSLFVPAIGMHVINTSKNQLKTQTDEPEINTTNSTSYANEQTVDVQQQPTQSTSISTNKSQSPNSVEDKNQNYSDDRKQANRGRIRYRANSFVADANIQNSNQRTGRNSAQQRNRGKVKYHMTVQS